jgi:hypothetical protein
MATRNGSPTLSPARPSAGPAKAAGPRQVTSRYFCGRWSGYPYLFAGWVVELALPMQDGGRALPTSCDPVVQ